MSAEPGLARFDTRRSAQTDEDSHQTNLRAIGAREHGQLALDELDTTSPHKTSPAERATTNEPSRNDFEAALGCARVTIAGLREQIKELEAERDRLRQERVTEEDR